MEGNIRLQSVVNWRTLLFFFLLLLPFNLLLFPARSSYLSALTKEKNPIIDTWVFYTPDRIFRVIGEMGESGRLLYALTEVSADLFYPLVGVLFLIILLAMLLPRAFPGSRLALSLVWLPVAICVFDFFENFGLFNLLISYPEQPVAVAWITSIFTLMKSVVELACLGLVLTSLAAMGIRAIRGSGRQRG